MQYKMLIRLLTRSQCLFACIDDSFISLINYPSITPSIPGELGYCNGCRVIQWDAHDPEQQYTLSKLHAQGAKFNEDSVTQKYLASIVRDHDKIERDYLISQI